MGFGFIILVYMVLSLLLSGELHSAKEQLLR
jgi:hypothetical protein